MDRSQSFRRHCRTANVQFAGFDQWLRNTRLTGSVEKYEGDGPYQNFGSDVHVAVLFNGHFDMAAYDAYLSGELADAGEG